MRFMRRKKLVVAVLILWMTAVLFGTAGAIDDFNLVSFHTPGGGGVSASEGFILDGSIGQPVIGSASGGDFRIVTGFWEDKGLYEFTGGLYLPLIFEGGP